MLFKETVGKALVWFSSAWNINKLSCLARNASHNDPVFFATKSIDLSSIVFKNSVYSLIRNMEIYLITITRNSIIRSTFRVILFMETNFEILDLKLEPAVCLTFPSIQTLKKTGIIWKTFLGFNDKKSCILHVYWLIKFCNFIVMGSFNILGYYIRRIRNYIVK